MLNKTERFELLRIIRYCCKVGLLPVQVNLSTWKILPHATRLTTWTCYFWFFLFVLHAFYKMVALVYWLEVGIQVHEVVVHAVLAGSMPVFIYWYYVLYLKYPGLFGVYFNITFTGNEDGYVAAVKRQKVKSLSYRLKNCTLQDMFAMSLPYTSTVLFLAMMLAFISKPSMKYLLYAALPKEHQSWITFCILLVEEWRLFMVILSIFVPLFAVQVISFELVCSKLQLLLDFMQRATSLRRCRNVYKSLRFIQLYIGITNLINSNIIFSCKLTCIGIAVGTGYAAIAHFSGYPIFGVMYYITFLNNVFVYTFCYDKAFKIPAMFQVVTQRSMLVAHQEITQASEIFKRQMRSFPKVGIKVGEFHFMERTSTLIFIDFVVNNIVSMLVGTRNG